MQSTPNAQKFGLRISNISCSGLPRVGILLKRPGSFFLKANIAGITRRTYIAERSNDPSWEDPLSFDLEGGGQLTIQVIDQHRPGKPKLIGELMSSIEIAGDFQDTKRFAEQPLVRRAKNNQRAGTVSFTLTRLNYFDGSASVRVQTQLAGANVSKMEGAAKTEGIMGCLSEADEKIEKAAKVIDIWKLLLDKVEIVVRIGNEIAEIHPYAQMVWSVLSPALKAIKGQKERDEMILRLVDAMNDAYDFVDLTKPLRAEDLGDARKEIIKKMLQQTYDCAWFIRDYTSRGFFGRALDGITSSHDTVVQQYIDTFGKLKTCFQDGSSVEIEITIRRTLVVVQEIHDDQILNDMPYAMAQRLAKGCLPGTREKILEEVLEWIHRPSAPSEEPEPCVYWLHGVAGCGKSAIASTLAQRFENMQRCAWYFFDASKKTRSGAEKMFSTLSRTLADMDAKWRDSLVKTIKSSRRLQTTLNVKEQFENFILKPATEFKPMGPILIVIDALDESGSKQDRMKLLQVLARLGELGSSGHFRFLITSRPEDDIQKTFENKPWVISKDLGETDESSVDSDIRLYVDAQLSQEPELLERFDKEPVDLVVSRAGRLFQWAFVACSYIRGIGESGVDPVERYIYLRDDPKDTRLDTLDELYTKVLKGLYGSGERNDKIVRFRKVLGRILSAREPLSLDALTELRSEDEGEREIERIVCSLGSLLKGVGHHDRQEPVQPLHASFIDFLTDPDRSEDFHVKAKSEDAVLARSSLRIMNEHLQFNICDLETSYKRNQDVKDMASRVRQHIPEHLSYACRYFAEHLSGREQDEKVVEFIRDFLWKKLLFWLEVLGLLRNISQALTELSALRKWAKQSKLEKEAISLIDDATRFVRAYGGTMEMSTPHIYLSAIAFIPSHSPLHKAYSDQYPGGIKVASDSGQSVKWTSMLLQINTLDSISAVGFSSDGTLIVSGSYDSSIQVWDAHTGQSVAGPFEGHTGPVTSAVFSPDGKLIVSGSEDSTIRVWDAHTGQLLGNPFLGHTDFVSSVAFSPDGRLIVSGSHDSTVRVWDAQTGQPVGDVLQGHSRSVSSVGFSSDGDLIVSGSYDRTVRVWDARSGEPIGDPFQGHDDWVSSVRFSPDGNLVVSGSYDGTLRIWEVHTGRPIGDPLQGHTDAIRSVGFSPDGKLVASASSDETVRIWDAKTGQPIGDPLLGHTNWLTSVAFSPIESLVVSGSGDGTIRVWDVYTGHLVGDPFRGHTDSITSLGFSHDGKLIASGSYDETVRIWDAHTGKLLSDLLQANTSAVQSVRFSPIGSLVVAGLGDGAIQVWDVHAAQPVGDPLQGHARAVTSVGFSPDGKFIVSGSQDLNVRVWNVQTGQPVGDPFQGHTKEVASVGFSPDGKLIVSSSHDMTVRAWDTYTGQLVGDPLQGHTDWVRSAVFSPDGKLIVSGSDDKTVRLWDIYAGQMSVGPFQGHTGEVASVGFSPDGELVVSGSWDNTVRIWNTRTGQPVGGPLRGHTGKVASVSFSPDGKVVVSGSYDSTLRMWDMQSYTASLLPGGPSNSSTSIHKSNGHQDLEILGNTVQYTDSSEIDDDGWILGPFNKLLFWVPPSYRPNLWRPGNIAVIGRNSLKLDLTRFVHGTHWRGCRKL